MSKDRFPLLDPTEARPGRVPLPPAFAVKAMTADTEGRFSLLEVVVARPIPRHIHDAADECIYVLDGELGIEFDDRNYTAGKGCFTLLPKGVPHALHPVSTPRPGSCKSPHPAAGSTTSKTSSKPAPRCSPTANSTPRRSTRSPPPTTSATKYAHNASSTRLLSGNIGHPPPARGRIRNII
ncbi:cupin domain-containing protein [Nocardia sp. NPDC051756]|uniref:cupin domain-containing protein n=1 Tax=Nocardia sp. NPDC051756 TaxID=3154751 RepID=UPI0034330D02